LSYSEHGSEWFYVEAHAVQATACWPRFCLVVRNQNGTTAAEFCR
jgi:hypothetical protein